MICFMCTFSPNNGYCYCSSTRLISIASTSNVPELLIKAATAPTQMHRRTKSEPPRRFPRESFSRRFHSLRVGRRKSGNNSQKERRIPIRISIVSICSSDRQPPTQPSTGSLPRKERRKRAENRRREMEPSSLTSSSLSSLHDVLPDVSKELDDDTEQLEEESRQLQIALNMSDPHPPFTPDCFHFHHPTATITHSHSLTDLGRRETAFNAHGVEKLHLDGTGNSFLPSTLARSLSYTEEMENFMNNWSSLDPTRDPFECDRMSRISDWVEKSEGGLMDSDRDVDVDFTDDVRRASMISSNLEEAEIIPVHHPYVVESQPLPFNCEADSTWSRLIEETTSSEAKPDTSSVVESENKELEDAIAQLPIFDRRRSSLPVLQHSKSIEAKEKTPLYSCPKRPTSAHGRRRSSLLEIPEQPPNDQEMEIEQKESDPPNTSDDVEEISYSRRNTIIDHTPLPPIATHHVEDIRASLRIGLARPVPAPAPPPEEESMDSPVEKEHVEMMFVPCDSSNIVVQGYSHGFLIYGNVTVPQPVTSRPNKEIHIKENGLVLDRIVFDGDLLDFTGSSVDLIQLDSEQSGEEQTLRPPLEDPRTPTPIDNLAQLLDYARQQSDPFKDSDWMRDLAIGQEQNDPQNNVTFTLWPTGDQTRAIPLAILMQRIVSSDSEGEPRIVEITSESEADLVRRVESTSVIWDSAEEEQNPKDDVTARNDDVTSGANNLQEISITVDGCSNRSRRSTDSEDFIPEELRNQAKASSDGRGKDYEVQDSDGEYVENVSEQEEILVDPACHLNQNFQSLVDQQLAHQIEALPKYEDLEFTPIVPLTKPPEYASTERSGATFVVSPKSEGGTFVVSPKSGATFTKASAQSSSKDVAESEGKYSWLQESDSGTEYDNLSARDAATPGEIDIQTSPAIDMPETEDVEAPTPRGASLVFDQKIEQDENASSVEIVIDLTKTSESFTVPSPRLQYSTASDSTDCEEYPRVTSMVEEIVLEDSPVAGIPNLQRRLTLTDAFQHEKTGDTEDEDDDESLEDSEEPEPSAGSASNKEENSSSVTSASVEEHREPIPEEKVLEEFIAHLSRQILENLDDDQTRSEVPDLRGESPNNSESSAKSSESRKEPKVVVESPIIEDNQNENDGDGEVHITINGTIVYEDDFIDDSDEKRESESREEEPRQTEGKSSEEPNLRKMSNSLSILSRGDTLQSEANSEVTVVSSDLDKSSLVKLNYRSNVDKAIGSWDSEVDIANVEKFWYYRYTKEPDERSLQAEKPAAEKPSTSAEEQKPSNLVITEDHVRRFYGMRTPLPPSDGEEVNWGRRMSDVRLKGDKQREAAEHLEIPTDPTRNSASPDSISIGSASEDDESDDDEPMVEESKKFFRLDKLSFDTDSDEKGRVEEEGKNDDDDDDETSYKPIFERRRAPEKDETTIKEATAVQTDDKMNILKRMKLDLHMPEVTVSITSPRSPRSSIGSDDSFMSDDEKELKFQLSGRKSVTFSEKIDEFRHNTRSADYTLKMRCSKSILKKEDKQRESIRRILEYAGERLYKDLCMLVEERDRTNCALEHTTADIHGLSPQSILTQTRYRDKLQENKGTLDAKIDSVWKKLKDSSVDYEKCGWIYTVSDSSQLTLKIRRRVLPRRHTAYFNIDRKKSDIELASEYAQKLARMRAELIRKDSEDACDDGYLGLLQRVSRTLGSSDKLFKKPPVLN